jgi:hypothetical protein
MKTHYLLITTLLLTLTACGPSPEDQATMTATALTATAAVCTATPSPTATETPTPTATSTVTPTATSTGTATPKPATLSGTIFISKKETKPFVTTVELRQIEQLEFVASTQTDENGTYKFENIAPGTYGLWVKLISKPEMVPGCYDLAPLDETWGTGIRWTKGGGVLMKNTKLSVALLAQRNLPSDRFLPVEFFMAKEGVEILPEADSIFDVTLICK